MKKILFNKWDTCNDRTYLWEYIVKDSGARYLKCVCKCWTIGYIIPGDFLRGIPKYCHLCKRSPIKKWDRYWRLVLTWRDEFRREWKRWDRVRYIECVCDCGNTIWTRLGSVKSWNTHSCWCLQKEKSVEGASLCNSTHGDSNTPFYGLYKAIKNRCENPRVKSYKYYGWRWIKCLRKTYEDFKNDMYNGYIVHIEEYWQRNTTIDRINVNWDYCKENCRWATKKEQANNTRANRVFVYQDVKYTLQQLSDTFWIKPETISCRLKRWWDLERAITEPLHKNQFG